ncbi:MAG: TonB-dependent receptor domain-containing protein, partial [Gemmatimonadota bacterium]
LELSAAHDPLAAADAGSPWRLPLRLGYTYTRANFETGFESDFGAWGTVDEGDELPYLPEHRLFAEAGLERGPWRATLTASGSSTVRTVAGQGPIPETESAGGYVVFGFAAGYDVTSGATLHLGVENLTDETYVAARRPAGARPGLPRTVQLGLRVSR